MQGSLTARIAIAVLLSVGLARAAPCEASIEVDVAPTPFDPPLAKLVSAQLTREAADGELCAESAKVKPVIRIEVRWPSADHASLHVEVRRGNAGRTAVRNVDLSKVPSDGRSLAVSIAATELVDEITAAERVAPSAEPVAPPPPPPKLRAPPRERERLGAFGPFLSIDAFTRGPTLLGPDARLSFMIAPRVHTTFRFGVRAPLASAPATSFVFGAALGVAARPLSEPWGVLGRLRVDAISLSSTSEVHDTVLVPAIGVGAWALTSRHVRLILDATAGAPIRAEGTTARGLVVSVTTGMAVSF